MVFLLAVMAPFMILMPKTTEWVIDAACKMGMFICGSIPWFAVGSVLCVIAKPDLSDEAAFELSGGIYAVFVFLAWRFGK